MNILLTNPKSINVFESFGLVFPPLGLLYVAASAEKKGFKVSVEDFFVSGNKPSNFNFSKYDVVGISTDTRRFPSALNIAKMAKAQGCTVVMGGPHAAFIDEDVLKEKFADFIINGEGEITFPELLNTIKHNEELMEVKGISYLNDNKLIRTKARELIADLDSIPFPARHLLDMNLYKKAGFKYGGKRAVTALSTSRGCPNECNFCVTPQMYGRKWRSRSPVSVLSEIEEIYHKYDYRAIGFCDDNFTVSPERVKELCSLILEKQLDIWWWSLSTANILVRNEDMVRLMAKAGAKTVYVGMESPNPSTLMDFNKKITTDIAGKAVNILRRNGIEIFASYILGGINDDKRGVLRTIKFARSLDTEVAQFTILTPYPGTNLFNKLEGSLRHKKWRLYDGLHLVFRHKNISFVLMELLLIWAYISYYTRGWRAIKGFIKALVKNTPVLRLFYGRTN